jgi:hypothetical protein
MDFHQALNTVIAELTPQPWEYTTPDGTTLTVIPRCFGSDIGEEEVMIRVTVDKTLAAECDTTTADMPTLLAAIESGEEREVDAGWRDFITLTPTTDGSFTLTVTEVTYPDLGRPHFKPAAICLPAAQRLPLVSALRRATDVAQAWEG